MINHDEIKSHITGVLGKKTGKEVVEEKIDDIDSGDVSPFFLALFGKQITLTAKIAQSYQTKFGMSLWEQISQKLATSVGWECKTQYKLRGNISPQCQEYIHNLLEDKEYRPKRINEIQEIRRKSRNFMADPHEYPDSTVDVFIKKPDGTEICIDITTVKPSKKEFRALKRKLLMWSALRFSQDDAVNFEPYIAIPYNPNAGANNEYNNHRGAYDRSDLLVGDELWKKVSNNEFGIAELISVFENIGTDLKSEIEHAINNHE